MRGEEHADGLRRRQIPQSRRSQLDDLVVVRVYPRSARVWRRIDGLLHDVKTEPGRNLTPNSVMMIARRRTVASPRC